MIGHVIRCCADDADEGSGGAAGKAAVPFGYGSGSSRPADGADGGMQTVGFTYGEDAAASASGDSREVSDADADDHAAGAPAPGAVPTVQPQPFVPRFRVPEELSQNLPETERMHKVRGPPRCCQPPCKHSDASRRTISCRWTCCTSVASRTETLSSPAAQPCGRSGRHDMKHCPGVPLILRIG